MIASGLKQVYKDIVNQAFYQDLGKDVILYFPTPYPNPSVGNAVSLYGDNNFDSFGNPLSVLDLGERQFQAATGITNTYTTGVIRARIYWQKDYLVDGHKALPNRICKLNAKKEDMPKLLQCAYINIDSDNGAIIKLEAIKTREAFPYGFGDMQSTISFWKVIN